MRKKYSIGVNGGHLRSTAVAICHETKTVAPLVYGSAINPHSIDESELFSRAEDLAIDLREHIAAVDRSVSIAVERVVVALPGVGLAREQSEVLPVLKRAFGSENVNVVDDTWAALFAVTQKPLGVCAFAGCGASVCIALGEFIPKKEFKIDGWGPVIGDFGSGFQLVTRFFRNLGRELDSDESNLFFEKVRQVSKGMNLYPELPSLELAQRWFDRFMEYHATDWRAQFARLAEPIIKLADSEDSGPLTVDARKLVESVAIELVMSLEICLQRHKHIDSTQLPLVLQGGVLRNSKYYQSLVQSRLGEKFREVTVAKQRPVVGALMMASQGFFDPGELAAIEAPIAQISGRK